MASLARRALVLVLALAATAWLARPGAASDELYDQPGFDPNRETYSLDDTEHIDPFTGGLTASVEDMRLPGNGGLDLSVRRTFNSKNVCETWLDANGSVTCQTVGRNNDSWVGLGWTLHFGKLYRDRLVTAPDMHVVEMPDGSRHSAWRKPSTTSYITKGYWIVEYEGTTLVAKLTDGTKIYFGHLAGATTDNRYDELYATRIVDPNANTITIAYYEPDAGADRLSHYAAIKSVTDSVGRVTAFNLTTSLIGDRHRLDNIVRPDGGVIRFQYTYNAGTRQALLTQVTPPVGNPWRYAYRTGTAGTIHDLTSMTTPHGGTISYTYATATLYFGPGYYKGFRVTTSKTTGGRDLPVGTWTFQYFQGSPKEYTVITDPNGRTVRYRHYGYDSGLTNGNLWRVGLPISKETTGSDGVVQERTSYTWARSASFISYEDYPISIWTDYEIYVPYLASKSILRGGTTYTTTYGNFDEYGNARTISGTGNTTRVTTRTYWYNASKNIVKDKVLSETVAAGTGGAFPGSFASSFAYDANTGRVLEENRFGVITKYAYFANGNRSSTTDANLNTTSYLWTNGAVSRITNPLYTVNRTINTNGTVASETNGRGFTTAYAYDGNLRLTRVTPPTGNPTTYTYASDNSYVREQRGGFSTTTYYDGIGRFSASSDSLGVATDAVYTASGPLNYTTSSVGDTTYYDFFGRTKTVTHQDGTSLTYTYSGSNVTARDEAGRYSYLYYTAFGDPDEKYLVSVTDADSVTTTYSRNILGALTRVVQGTTTRTFAYNTKSFLTSETHPEQGTITYGRDANGNMVSKADGFRTKAYTYDKLNRLTSITAAGSTQATYGYDNADNRTSMSSPASSVTYSYDAASRLTGKTETILGRAYTTAYTYDANDNVTKVTYPTGTFVTYAYNTYDQVTSALDFGGSVTSIIYRTTGSATGRPQSYLFSNGVATTLTYNTRNQLTRISAPGALDVGYAYDSRGNTTSLTNYLDTSRNQAFSYDNLSRLTSSSGAWGSGSFTYDLLGNRKSKTVGGVSTTYAYNTTANRLASTSGGETATYAYNNAGSLTERTVVGAPYVAPGTVLAQYGYNGDGLRVTKAAGGKTTVYHYDAQGRVLCETDHLGTRIADYVYLHGKVVARRTGAGVEFYHTDPAGTALSITNAAKAVVWRADYKPFGEESVLAAAAPNARQFAGKDKDAETGLHYFGARYLDSKIGRFCAVDAIGPVDAGKSATNEKLLLQPQELNPYAYAVNNPYRYADPDGNVVWDVVDVAFWGYSAARFFSSPSWINAADLVLDTAGLLPIVPSLGTYRRVAAAGIEGAAGAAKAAKGGADVGRAGKQARLRELVNEDKLSSADRGWIKQEMNSIERGQRSTIRNPPGKDLAHERGREAAKGYDYKHSNLQDRDLHRLQHKYDDFGQANAERPFP